ncbi:MAG: hypothetical protein HY238_13840 [Acidobacteria bacterium]|nr:hypothetical protein [Acidobacteriota bacterium]
MHPDLGLVRELQDLDHRIAELTREISYLPKHIAEIESKLESHKKKLEVDRASLTANQKERKRLEDDIKVVDGKISRLRDQMNEAKTNEQYRAFQHEIEFGQAEIRKIEDKILDYMAEAETLDQNVKSAETALKQEMAEVEKEKKAAEQRTAADRAELAQGEARRAAAAQGVTPKTLHIYERIRKSRGGVAVSVARDGRCMACNVILRLHFYQKVRSNDEVLTCEVCGRILFYLPPEEAPKEVVDCRLQSAEPLP